VNQHFCVPSEQVGIELDEFLCRLFPLHKKRDLRALVRDGRITVNGGSAMPAQRLREDDVVSCDIDEDDFEAAAAPTESIDPPTVLFEDEHVMVLDKPADLLVEPDRWDAERPNLIGGLHAISHFRTEAGEGAFRPRLAHRLDKDTSGCIVVAKTVDAERALGAAFESGAVRKRYLALVEGEHPLADGESETIDLPIGPDRRRSGHMSVQTDGKPSQTVVRVEQRFRGYTLLACEPLTGRTHQIRVHLSAQGFPLAVDPLYGRRRALLLSEIKANYRPKRGQPERPLIGRLTLHAAHIEFPRVRDSAARVDDSTAHDSPTVSVSSPLPADFERALRQLGKWRPPRR